MKGDVENSIEECFYETLERAKQRKINEKDKKFLECAKTILEKIIHSTNGFKTLEEYREYCKKNLAEVKKYV